MVVQDDVDLSLILVHPAGIPIRLVGQALHHPHHPAQEGSHLDDLDRGQPGQLEVFSSSRERAGVRSALRRCVVCRGKRGVGRTETGTDLGEANVSEREEQGVKFRGRS